MKARPAKHAGAVVIEMNRRDEPLMAVAATTASPFRLKKILVPIDFSDCSRKALEYAIPLAGQHEATLALLHVVTPAFVPGEYGTIEYPPLEADMHASGEMELRKLAADQVPSPVSADTQVRIGSPSAEILEAARQLPADLIVISTHGRTGLRHVFLGSVAEDVVRRAPCPVLVVREDEREFLAD